MEAPDNLLILGAGIWQKPYLQQAQTMGCRVYACDWSVKPAAKQQAHVFEQIDLKDTSKVLQFAYKHKIDGIISPADIGVPAAALVAEKLQLPFHSTKLALYATNKYRMRKKARQIGMTVPKFMLVSTIHEAVAASREIGYPFIIKPTDNCSSRGVFVINNKNELNIRFSDSIKASFENKILIESLAIGTEGSIEAVIQNNIVTILGICDKIKSPLPYRYDLQLNYPGNYTHKQYEQLEYLVNKLVSGFNIKAGMLHIEFIILNNKVTLIEFGLRGCGSNVMTHLIPAMTGFNTTEFAIKQSLNKNTSIDIQTNLCGILKFFSLKNGVIKSIQGEDRAKKVDGIVDLNIEKRKGDAIGHIKNGRDRPGYCIAVGKTLKKVEKSISIAESKIKINYL